MVGAQDHGAAHHVFKLAHIAGPGVLQQLGLCLGLQLPRLFVVLQQALHGQGNDVARALGQGQQTHAEGGNAVVQVFAEFALGDGFFQVFVGGGHDAHVQLDGGLSTQAGELTLLQHAQQLALQVHGHLADLVQEQGAALGLLKQTLLLTVCARESAFFVTKQHVFDQIFWHGRAIECDKWAFGAARGLVQHAGQHFFARAGRADQQGGHIGLRHFLGHGQQVLAGRVYKHHVAHRLRCQADGAGVELIVQTQPRSLAYILSGQHRECARLRGFYGQVQRLALDTTHHWDAQASILQKLLNGFEARHISREVQHHHGRIGGLGQQVVESVDWHHGPAAQLQSLAVLGAQGCFGVQPKGQRIGRGL